MDKVSRNCCTSTNEMEKGNEFFLTCATFLATFSGSNIEKCRACKQCWKITSSNTDICRKPSNCDAELQKNVSCNSHWKQDGFRHSFLCWKVLLFDTASWNYITILFLWKQLIFSHTFCGNTIENHSECVYYISPWMSPFQCRRQCKVKVFCFIVMNAYCNTMGKQIFYITNCKW